MQRDTRLVDNGDGWQLELTRFSPAGGVASGARPVLMVPGYAMNSFILSFHPTGVSMVEYLVNDGLEVWTVDLRGQGGSRRVSGGGRFGLRELSLVDVPAAIRHVLQNTTTGADLYYEETWTCEATPNDGDDDGTIASDSVTSSSDSTDFVIFVTDPFLGSSSASWLTDRADADAYCASEAASEGITGSDWSIMYSTGSEDARDHVDYDSSRGDRVFDRNGRQVDNGDLWSTSYVLPDMNSWTIVSTGTSGTFQSCSGSYPSGSWPICQYCSQKFACGSSSDRPFVPGDCCWTGTRSVICLGKL